MKPNTFVKCLLTSSDKWLQIIVASAQTRTETFEADFVIS